MPLFGGSAPLASESNVEAEAVFRYNITNFRVQSNTAGCGGLSGADTFTFAVRQNLVDTSLQANCTSATPAGATLLDTDVVEVLPGDVLTLRVTRTAGFFGQTLMVGITLEGSSNLTFEDDDDQTPGPTGPTGLAGAMMTLIDLPGMTSVEVGAVLIFLGFLVLAYFQRWLFVAIASLIGVLDLMLKDAQGPAPVLGFTFTFLLLIIGIILEMFRDMRDARDAEKEGAGIE